MKFTAILGVILIVIGLAGFAIGHIDFTTREKVVDFGPVQISADKEHSVAIPDAAAAIALIGGIGLVLAGQKRG